MVSKFSRRATLAGLGTVSIAGFLPGFALALTTNQARQLVDQLVSEINNVINSGGSEEAMLRRFEGIFERYANTQVIALRVLGADARSASKAELNAFMDAFAGYISRKYGKRFREFIGGEIIVNEARAVKSWHEVQTTANLRGEPPFRVDFLIKEAGGKNLFFDMVIEGISLTRVEREEIGSMLDARGRDLSRLTQDLRRMG